MMCRVFLGIALSCTLLLAPFSAAAQSTDLSENLCAPVFDDEFEQNSSVYVLDDQQDPNVRIDLLENGINPGFTSVPEIDYSQMMESVAQFQAVNNLSVTGRLDEQTQAKLNIRNPKMDPASAAIERAKPSK